MNEAIQAKLSKFENEISDLSEQLTSKFGVETSEMRSLLSVGIDQV